MFRLLDRCIAFSRAVAGACQVGAFGEFAAKWKPIAVSAILADERRWFNQESRLSSGRPPQTRPDPFEVARAARLKALPRGRTPPRPLSWRPWEYAFVDCRSGSPSSPAEAEESSGTRPEPSWGARQSEEASDGSPANAAAA
jgi:hypothetical protein